MSYDLHSHTIHSDGRATPFDVVRMAWAGGMTGIAISDHDTTSHFDETAESCAVFGLEWVPAIELSAEVPAAAAAGPDAPPRSVHLLALWVDPAGTALQAELDRLARLRATRAERMVERINEMGGAVDFGRVLELAAGAPATRPHVARAMVEAGVVPTVGRAFADYIGDDGPAYVAKQAADPVRCVELIREAGGVAVLAHPTWGGVDRVLLDAMCTAGLAGIESPSERYEPQAVHAWRQVAADRDLLVTTGSDYHGPAQVATPLLEGTPVRTAEALRSRAGGELNTW